MTDIFTIDKLLENSSKITSKYAELTGPWSVAAQIAHIHSEVSEVYQAVRHGESRERVLEEIVDVFLTTFTLCNIMNVQSTELNDAFTNKLATISKRIDVLSKNK